MQVSIIIPVIRPKKVKDCIAAIKKYAGIPEDQYEILAEEDTECIGAPKMVERLTEKANSDSIMFLGDDTLPEENFLKIAVEKMKELPDGWGLVGLNTQDIGKGKAGNPIAHWLGHKKLLEYLPEKTFFSTAYNHSYCDNELKEVAEEMGRWIWAEDSRILHSHPINRTAKLDKNYKRVYSKKTAIDDEKTYYNRKRKRMADKYGTKLAIGLPLTDRFVYNEFFFSFVKVLTTYMISLCNSGKMIALDILAPDFPGTIDAVRNDLAIKALKIGATHLLFMDTDQIYETSDMIEKLLEHKKPMMAARVHRRYPPFDPILLRGEISKFYNIPDNEIEKEDGSFAPEISIDYAGTGCILVDTQIFIDIFPGKPFKIRRNKKGKPIGEDIDFFDKIKKMNISAFADCRIEIPHLTFMATGWGEYKLFNKLNRR